MASQNVSLLLALLVLQLLGPAPVGVEASPSPRIGMQALDGAEQPEQRIASRIKETLTALTEEDIASLMERHLQLLGLRTQTQPSSWAHPRLANFAPMLLPGNVTRHHLAEMVDVMAMNAARNPYLHSFLMRAGGPDTAQLLQRVDLEGGRVLPDVVTYAVVLDRLNWFMIRDWRTMEVCQEVWSSRYTFLSLSKMATPFEVMKTYAIESVFNDITKFLKTKKPQLDVDYALHGQINIAMAMSEDTRLLNNDNALAGQPLLQLGGGGKRGNIAQFAQLSADGQTVETRPPLPLQWADLYTTWNMAFVSHLPNFPYFIVKLLIPTVSDYQDYPEAFIHHRLTTLWATINYQIAILGLGGPDFDWSSKALTQSWGRVNKESAADYTKQLSEATKSV